MSLDDAPIQCRFGLKAMHIVKDNSSLKTKVIAPPERQAGDKKKSANRANTSESDFSAYQVQEDKFQARFSAQDTPSRNKELAIKQRKYGFSTTHTLFPPVHHVGFATSDPAGPAIVAKRCFLCCQKHRMEYIVCVQYCMYVCMIVFI